jgi:glycerol kinase
MSAHVLAIDQGTTGSTAVLLDEQARVVGKATREFEQHFPRPGWVEHDLGQIQQSVADAVAEAYRAAGLSAADCRALGITNQRETTVVWEREGGRPIHRAIVWQDRRTADICAELRTAGHEPRFRERTGLVCDPYFSGTKIAWILDHVDGARARAQRGELAFGTIDSWLVSWLSGGAVHVTDTTNASRTLLFDLHALRWDPELAALLRVPLEVLPEVRSSSEVYAHTRGLSFLPDGVPIAGIAGDQQAALFGQACFAPGDAKCTYGTGAFLLLNTGERPVPSTHGLLTTVAWTIGGRTTYALEGSAFIAGAAVQWLRDGLGLVRSAAEVEALAARVPSSGDVAFVPALAGLGAPHWDPHARGLLCGLTRDTTAAHVARAVLEGVALQIHDIVEAMVEDAGRPLGRLRVDGGAASNDLLMQFQSDVLAAPIDRPASVETTAIGAAMLAGLAVGFFGGMDQLAGLHRVARSYEPAMSDGERARHLAKWRAAVARAITRR